MLIQTDVASKRQVLTVISNLVNMIESHWLRQTGPRLLKSLGCLRERLQS